MGWKGPKYRKFDTRAEAEAFVKAFNTKSSAAAAVPAAPDSLVDEDEEPPAKKAKKATKTAITPVPIVYTDGSSLGNGKHGASAGVGVHFGPNDPRFVAARIF